MKRQTISCDNCGRSWAVVSAFTLYEQQAVESRPCPCCGAYTLCCPEASEPQPPSRSRRPRTAAPWPRIGA